MSDIVTDLGFDSKSLWQPKGFESQLYPELTWPYLKELNLKRVSAIEGEDLTLLQEGVIMPIVDVVE